MNTSKNTKNSSVSSCVLVSLLLLSAATAIGWLFRFAEFPETNIVIVYLLSVLLIARMTRGFVYGISASFIATFAFNYKKIIIAEIAIGVIATLCFEFLPLQIIGIFGSESALYNEFAVIAFRLYLSTMVLCCVQKATSIFLQALGKPVMSMGLSLLRDFVLSVPLIILMASVMGVEGPLLSAPIADGISIIVVCLMMKSVMKGLGETNIQENSQKKQAIPEGNRLQTVVEN